MFKSIKKKNIRRRRNSSVEEEHASGDEEGKPCEVSSIDDAKELQKLRRRQHGVSAEDLGAVIPKAAKVTTKKDPLKMEKGGFVDMKALKKSDFDEEAQDQIGTTFATETNRRDEDAEMLKYVEIKMQEKKGNMNKEEEKNKQRNPEDALYELPENIKELTSSSAKRSEDMLSNQMLSGIPEVDLGIESKIKNIEQTEEAKQRIIQERLRKKEEGVSLVPTNYAVNFVQHNRFKVEEPTLRSAMRRAAQAPVAVVAAPVRVGDADTDEPEPREEPQPKKRRGKDSEKATDDFVYDRFKKQVLRRY